MIKKLQIEKENLSATLAIEKSKSTSLSAEKDSLSKRNKELEAEVAQLRALAQTAEAEKSRANGLQLSLDAKCKEVEELFGMQTQFEKLKKDHQEYTNAIDECFHYIHAELKKLLTDFGSPPPLLDFKDCIIGDMSKEVVDGIQSLGINGRAFGELGDAISARTLAHAIFSLMTTPPDGGDLVITKSDLRHLYDREYTWPTDVSADKIPPFPKNITKNFMRDFFQQVGYALTVEEGRRLFHQVFFSFCLCLLFMTHCSSLPNSTLYLFV